MTDVRTAAPGRRMGIFALVAPALLPAASAAATVQDPSDAIPPDYAPGEHRVFTGSGAPASLADVVDAMARHEVVFVGETHDDPTGHRLELELLERAYRSEPATRRPVALSLEFFERDVQLVLDEYLGGLISEASFRDAARPWPRYETDYRPLVEFAKTHGIELIAANAPRRYVSRVSRHGRESLEALSAEARESLPPLPWGSPSDAYRRQWIEAMSEVVEQEGMTCGVPDPEADAPVGSHADMGNQLASQTLWDATMAWSISGRLERGDALVVHVAGGFHVARGTGTPEHLEAYRPGTRAMIVMLRPVEDIETFEPAPEGEWGDFVIQTDAARTLEAIECRERRGEPDG